MHRAAHRGAAAPAWRSFATRAGQLHLAAAQHDAAAVGAGGAGPCALPGGHGWIVFDGVLYNRAEIDASLAQGPLPDSMSVPSPGGDALRVLALFERGGMAALAGVAGMFAFVLWDGRRERLHAVRDRYGTKPLYLYRHGDTLAFASEIKQFFALPGSRARLDVDAGLDFLAAGLTDQQERTMFAGVLRVPAGAGLELAMAQWTPESALPAWQPWYQLPKAGSLTLDLADASGRFRQLFAQAVASQAAQAPPPALCLSGGLDSSAIAMLLPAPAGSPLIAYKACFGDPLYDEPELFQAVLARCGGISRVTFTGGADPFRLLDKLVWHMDEPFARASLAAQWMLFELAAQHGVRGTLDGQGSDEQLGGYMSMVAEHRAFMSGPSCRAAEGGAGASARAAATYACFAAPWSNILAARGAAAGAAARPLGLLCRERMERGDLPMMMRHNDRIGAAHGIDTHVPFMDHRLVDFTIALGEQHKLRGAETKLLLRRALADLLPPPLLAHRGKGSYSELEAGWLRNAGNVALRRAVADSVAEWPQLFCAAGVAEAWALPSADAKEQLMLFWRIACFGSWARRFEIAL